MVIAYHNGAEIGTLEDDTIPPNDPPLSKSLANRETTKKKSRLFDELFVAFDLKIGNVVKGDSHRC